MFARCTGGILEIDCVPAASPISALEDVVIVSGVLAEVDARPNGNALSGVWPAAAMVQTRVHAGGDTLRINGSRNP